MKISVVIPVYGCRLAIPQLYKRLTCTLRKISNEYELIMIDDACPQNSWSEIRTLCKTDFRVKGIRFSRNFGQTSAITAGLRKSTGDFVVVMDCDLQDPPEAIIDLYNKIMDGYDVVFAKREQRKDSTITLVLSRIFYNIYGIFTDERSDRTIGNFCILRRIVVNNYCRMNEKNRAFTLFIHWLGFSEAAIPVSSDSRYDGELSYNFRKKIKLAVSIITAQSNKPLLISIKLGFLMSALSFLYIVYLVLRCIFVSDILIGWTTIIASIYFIGGLIISFIGVVGIYIGNIFDEVKNRPLYIVSEEIN